MELFVRRRQHLRHGRRGRDGRRARLPARQQPRLRPRRAGLPQPLVGDLFGWRGLAGQRVRPTPLKRYGLLNRVRAALLCLRNSYCGARIEGNVISSSMSGALFINGGGNVNFS